MVVCRPGDMDHAADPCGLGDGGVGQKPPQHGFIAIKGEMDAVKPPAKDMPTVRKRRIKRERRKMRKEKTLAVESSPKVAPELPLTLASSADSQQGFAESESTQKKMKRTRGDCGARVDSGEEEKKKQKSSQRPNYFVSIPITNAQISAAVVEMQEAVLLQEPRLVKAMIPAPTLHITLLVTHLASEEQVSLAATALDKAMPSLAELLGGRDLVLPFCGVGHFRKEVVFVGLAPGQHRDTLEKLAEVLRRCFEEQGLLQEECRGFEPHLTIMKLSKAPKLRSQGLKRVNPDLYSSYTGRCFGDQKVERVDLCSMLKKKQQDGYYHTESSLLLGGRQRQEPSEAELQRVSKRLVEDAVNRALHQYKQETLQNGGGPNTAAAQPPENTKESTVKLDTTANSTTDNRK